jgi:outer membrane protein assembly factor BamB
VAGELCPSPEGQVIVAGAGILLSRSFVARALTLSALLSSIALSAACGDARAPVPSPTATAAPDRPPATVYLSAFGSPSESSVAVTYSVTALDPADGSIRWRHPFGVGESILGALVIADGNVYIETSLFGVGTAQPQGMLTALRGGDGLVRWRYHTGLNFAMAADNGVLYLDYVVNTEVSPQNSIVARAGVMLALDAASGTLRWQTSLTGPPADAPLVAGANIYLALASPKVAAPGAFAVIALDARTGAPRWHSASATMAHVVAVSDGVVYVQAFGHNGFGQADDTLVALDVGSGGMRWQLPAADAPYGPLIVNGALYVVATIHPADPNGETHYVAESVDAETGKVRWQTTLQYSPAQLAVAGDSVYIACAGAASLASNVNRLIALDAGTGAMRWRDGAGPFSSSGASSLPVVNNGVVYVYTLTDASAAASGGGVMALDGRDGTHLWAAPVPIADESVDRPIQVTGGRIYALTLGFRPHLLVLATQTGAELWRYDEPHGSVTAISLSL